MRKEQFDALSKQDQITYMIGRAARLSVSLEHRTQLVWQVMVGDSVARYAIPRGPRDIIDALTKMLPHIGLTEDELAACLAALRAIDTAHSARHVAVHSNWALRSDTTDAWNPLPRDWRDILSGKSKPSWTISDFVGLESKFIDAGRRAIALMAIIREVLPSGEEEIFRQLRRERGESVEDPIDLRPLLPPILLGVGGDPALIENFDGQFLMVVNL